MHKPKDGQKILSINFEKTMKLCRDLSKKLPSESIIYGVPRNGLIISGLLAYSGHFLYKEGDLSFGSKPRNIIVVDDIHDSGTTLGYYKNIGHKIASLFWRKKDGTKPDYYVEEVDDEWVEFEWEKL